MKRILALLMFLAFAGSFQMAKAQFLGNGNITASGTGCTTGSGSSTSCVIVAVPQDAATLSFTISGTFSATLQFKVSQDGTNFVAVNAYPPNSTTAVNNTTSPGTWSVGVAGMSAFEVYASSYTSGTAVVAITGSKALAGILLHTGGGGGTGCVPGGAVGVIQASNGLGACQSTALTDNGVSITTSEPLTGSWDFSGASAFKLRVAAGLTTAANGDFGFDSTSGNWHGWNGADVIMAPLAGGFVSGHCGQPTSSTGKWVIADSGAACGTGTGGGSFSLITSGTNTAAAMVVGTGSSISVTGSGTNDATTLGGKTFAAPAAIGSGTPASGAFTTLSATGQFTSTLATGTAPFVVASTTLVSNLNASFLGGATFAAPGTIGGTTPGAAVFTTIAGNFAAHGVLLGEGNGSNIAVAAAGTSGQPFLSGGASADGAYGALNIGGAAITGTLGTGNGGSGLANPTAHSFMVSEGSSPFTLVTSPSVNGDYTCGFNVTASAATDPNCALDGVPVNAQNTNYTLLYSDRASFLRWSGGTTATLTLPAATGNIASNFPFVAGNFNSGNLTVTATSPNTIDGGAAGGSITVLPNWASFAYQDSTPNWFTLRVPTVAAFPTCGDATHALNFSATGIGCQAITATAAAGGSTTQVQYNNAGSLGGIAQWTTNGTTTLTGSSTATLDLSAMLATAGLKLPAAAGAAPTTAGIFSYDTTANRLAFGNGTNTSFPTWITAAPTTLHLAEFNGTSGLVDDSGVATANVVTAASNAAAANQVWTSGGANKTAVATDFPDYKSVPFCVNVNGTAATGVTTSTAVACTARAGTNNKDAFYGPFTTSDSVTFKVHLPKDWDTGTAPSLAVDLASTDTTSGHTVILQAATECAKLDGSTTDDVAFNAAQSLSTVTLNTTANQTWTATLASLTTTGCSAPGIMWVKITRTTDTSTNVELYEADVTIPRRIVMQAN